MNVNVNNKKKNDKNSLEHKMTLIKNFWAYRKRRSTNWVKV